MHGAPLFVSGIFFGELACPSKRRYYATLQGWLASGGAICTVVMSAGLAMGALPKVLVDEKNLGTIAASEVEALAVVLLGEKEVETVDQDMLEANLKRTQSALKGAGDSRGAAALGREFGADVVLLGKAVAKPSANRIAGSNLRSYQGVVAPRAVRTDNAFNMAASSETATAVSLEDAGGGLKGTESCWPQVPRRYHSRDVKETGEDCVAGRILDERRPREN